MAGAGWDVLVSKLKLLRAKSPFPTAAKDDV
jgi:hypothetical protein